VEKARSQPLKWHTWSMKILQDPTLTEQRLDLTKPISLVYVIDDIFDVYGELEELTIFTRVVERYIQITLYIFLINILSNIMKSFV